MQLLCQWNVCKHLLNLNLFQPSLSCRQWAQSNSCFFFLSSTKPLLCNKIAWLSKWLIQMKWNETHIYWIFSFLLSTEKMLLFWMLQLILMPELLLKYISVNKWFPQKGQKSASTVNKIRLPTRNAIYHCHSVKSEKNMQSELKDWIKRNTTTSN